jgi:hypothetical protein
MLAYLEAFGCCDPDGQVLAGRTSLSICVARHQELEGHTFYQLQCLLVSDGFEPLRWQVGKRLRHMRVYWHDRVKAELGEKYAGLFGECRFAPRGGGKGTSRSLSSWCQRLAGCCSAGSLGPSVLALSLRFLEAPQHQVRKTGDANTMVPVLAAEACPTRLACCEDLTASNDCRCSAAGSGDEFASGGSTHCGPDRGSLVCGGSDQGSDCGSAEESACSDSDCGFRDRIEDWDSDFMTDNASSDDE